MLYPKLSLLSDFEKKTANRHGRRVGQRTEAGLLNKRLMLSTSFRCDQIYKYDICSVCISGKCIKQGGKHFQNSLSALI